MRVVGNLGPVFATILLEPQLPLASVPHECRVFICEARILVRENGPPRARGFEVVTDIVLCRGWIRILCGDEAPTS